MNPFRARLVGLAAGGLVALTIAGSVLAASPAPGAARAVVACAAERLAARANPSVATLRALGDCEIASRITTLDRLATSITDARYLTAAHRSALQAIVRRTRDGLASLKGQSDAAGSVAELKVDLPKIARDYRVYVLVAPQVHLTRAADAQLGAAARFDTLAGKLQGRIDAAKGAGKDVGQAQAALDAMKASVASAKGAASGVPAAILPLLPAGFNDGTAGPILDTARHAVASARDALAAARKDAAACIAALKTLG